MKQGYVDLHSHLLPGVDDGAQSLEEAMEMLHIAYEEGIRTIIATPHYALEDRAQSRDKALISFELMKKVVKREYPEMELYLGNELYYTPGVLEDIKEGRVHTIGESKYVLVEFSPGITYQALYQAIRELVMARYRPILAHVERYQCLFKEFDKLEEIIELGVYLQMNCQSLSGGFLDENARWCKKLVRQGYITFLGTDAHNTKERAPKMKAAAQWVEKKCGSERVEELFGGNARKALANESIEL